MGLTSKNFIGKPKVDFHTSWDDGSELDLKVADILEKHGFIKNSTFYIVVDWVDTPGFLTWDQVKDLDKRGFKIGSHTLSHPMDLKELHDDFLHTEINSSKELIESVLNHPISSFCYPRGRFDSRVKRQVQEAGYINARTTGKPGRFDASDPYALPGTLHVYNGREEYEGETWDNFGKKILNSTRDKDYFNLWGHSNEIEEHNQWVALEEFLKYAKQYI